MFALDGFLYQILENQIAIMRSIAEDTDVSIDFKHQMMERVHKSEKFLRELEELDG